VDVCLRDDGSHGTAGYARREESEGFGASPVRRASGAVVLSAQLWPRRRRVALCVSIMLFRLFWGNMSVPRTRDRAALAASESRLKSKL